jgi:hypothetical protein
MLALWVAVVKRIVDGKLFIATNAVYTFDHVNDVLITVV